MSKIDELLLQVEKEMEAMSYGHVFPISVFGNAWKALKQLKNAVKELKECMEKEGGE